MIIWLLTLVYDKWRVARERRRHQQMIQGELLSSTSRVEGSLDGKTPTSPGRSGQDGVEAFSDVPRLSFDYSHHHASAPVSDPVRISPTSYTPTTRQTPSGTHQTTSTRPLGTQPRWTTTDPPFSSVTREQSSFPPTPPFTLGGDVIRAGNGNSHMGERSHKSYVKL
jgi:hypothetical protein